MPRPRSPESLFANVRARYDALMTQERSVAGQLAELETRRQALLVTQGKLAEAIGQIESTLTALADPAAVVTPPPAPEVDVEVLEGEESTADEVDSTEHAAYPFRRFYKKTRQDAALRALLHTPGLPYAQLVVAVYGVDSTATRKRLRALVWQMKTDGLIRPVPGADENSGRYELSPRNSPGERANGQIAHRSGGSTA